MISLSQIARRTFIVYFFHEGFRVVELLDGELCLHLHRSFRVYVSKAQLGPWIYSALFCILYMSEFGVPISFLVRGHCVSCKKHRLYTETSVHVVPM